MRRGQGSNRRRRTWFWRATKTGRGLCTHPELEGLIKGGRRPSDELPAGWFTRLLLAVFEVAAIGLPTDEGTVKQLQNLVCDSCHKVRQ